MYRAIILLSMLPITGLGIWSTVNLGRTSDFVPASEAKNTEEEKASLEADRADAVQSKLTLEEYLKQCRQPLVAEPAKNMVTDSQEMYKLDKKLRAVWLIRDLARECAPVRDVSTGAAIGIDEQSRKRLIEEVARLRDRQSRLQGISLRRVEFASLGVEDTFQLVDGQLRAVSELLSVREKELEGLTGTLASLRENSINRQAAAEHFVKGEYQQCIQKLRAIHGEMTQSDDTLLQRASFRSTAGDLVTRERRLDKGSLTDGSKAFREWTEMEVELESLMTNYREPPTEADRSLHATCKGLLESTQVQVALARLGNIGDWDRFLAASKSVSSTYGSAATRQAIRQRLRTLLLQNLQPKREPDSKLRETVVKPGLILQGVFEPHGGAWRYWSDHQAMRTNRDGYVNYTSDQLMSPIGPPRAVKCSEEFNSALAPLQGSLARKAQWERFLATCERLQKEMTEYRKLGGTSELSFDSEIRFANRVLETWESSQVGEILSED